MATVEHNSRPRQVSVERDLGATFIEALVSIVLLGTSVVGVLVALGAVTRASTIDADHARAFELLHDASDAIYEAQRYPCATYDGTGDEADASNWQLSPVGSAGDSWDDGDLTIIGWYNDEIRDRVTAPEGWAAADVRVTKVEFLAGDDTGVFTWGSACFEGVQGGVDEDYRRSPLISQKVTITVVSPDGELTKQLETVIS